MIALDSNVVIDLMRGHPIVRENYFRAVRDGAALHMSSIVYEELAFDIACHRDPARERTLLLAAMEGVEITPFEPQDAERVGSLRAEMRRRGTPGPYADSLIGAHAQARGQTLVTANTKDFENIPGLQLLDWTQPPPPEQDSEHV